MEEVLIPVLIVGMLFIALPWIILHYVTRWKATSRLTAEDETMLDDLYELARRLDDRMTTIERIIQDENPNWNSLAPDRSPPRLERPAAGDLTTRIGADRLTAPDLSKSRRL
jgi:phage shock protein B